MTEYESLAGLRAAMTSDDPDERVDAYIAVRDAGLDPENVLSSEPPEQALVDVGLVPERGGGGPTPVERHEELVGLLERMADLLDDIAANTGAS